MAAQSAVDVPVSNMGRSEVVTFLFWGALWWWTWMSPLIFGHPGNSTWGSLALFQMLWGVVVFHRQLGPDVKWGEDHTHLPTIRILDLNYIVLCRTGDQPVLRWACWSLVISQKVDCLWGYPSCSVLPSCCCPSSWLSSHGNFLEQRSLIYGRNLQKIWRNVALIEKRTYKKQRRLSKWPGGCHGYGQCSICAIGCSGMK